MRLLRPIRHRDDVMDIGGGGGEGGGVGGGETGEKEEEEAAATATGKGGKGGGTCGASDAGGSWPVVEAIEHALTDVATSCPLLESQAISRPAEDWEHWLRERRKADLQ